MIESDFFLNEVKKQYKEQGNRMYYDNQKYISDLIKSNDDSWIAKTTLNNLIPGSVYFIYYDLNGKSSNMEKMNPVLYLEQFNIDNTIKLYCMNINFLPITIRTLFFNELINSNLDVVDKNYSIDVIDQKPLSNINFSTIYNMLRTVGFEWAIRKLDIHKINNVIKISTNILPKFVTMSTAQFTGVDDAKLIDIWQSKIKDRDERDKRIIGELLKDFQNVKNEFNDKFNSIIDQEENIRKSINIIKNM